MLTFLANWFRTADRAAQKAVASPDVAIAYKPALIEELQAEHRELMHLFKVLVAAHQRGDHDAAV